MHGQTFSFESQRSVFTATLKGGHSGLKMEEKNVCKGLHNTSEFCTLMYCIYRKKIAAFINLKKTLNLAHFDVARRLRGQTVQNIFFSV